MEKKTEEFDAFKQLISVIKDEKEIYNNLHKEMKKIMPESNLTPEDIELGLSILRLTELKRKLVNIEAHLAHIESKIPNIMNEEKNKNK